LHSGKLTEVIYTQRYLTGQGKEVKRRSRIELAVKNCWFYSKKVKKQLKPVQTNGSFGCATDFNGGRFPGAVGAFLQESLKE
jgi:hypothetical protein